MPDLTWERSAPPPAPKHRPGQSKYDGLVSDLVAHMGEWFTVEGINQQGGSTANIRKVGHRFGVTIETAMRNGRFYVRAVPIPNPEETTTP